MKHKHGPKKDKRFLCHPWRVKSSFAQDFCMNISIRKRFKQRSTIVICVLNLLIVYDSMAIFTIFISQQNVFKRR